MIAVGLNLVVKAALKMCHTQRGLNGKKNLWLKVIENARIVTGSNNHYALRFM